METTDIALIYPPLGALYEAAGAWLVLLLRVWIGSVLFLYALRSSFRFFPNTGMPVQTIPDNAAYMEQYGWRPGLFWAWLSTINNLVGGAFLAVGFLTRPAALTSCILLFLSAGHHVKDGFFSNQNGVEHYALWGLATALFVILGGGPFSVDALIGWQF